jgi:hypothetical protein
MWAIGFCVSFQDALLHGRGVPRLSTPKGLVSLQTGKIGVRECQPLLLVGSPSCLHGRVKTIEQRVGRSRSFTWVANYFSIRDPTRQFEGFPLVRGDMRTHSRRGQADLMYCVAHRPPQPVNCE